MLLVYFTKVYEIKYLGDVTVKPGDITEIPGRHHQSEPGRHRTWVTSPSFVWRGKDSDMSAINATNSTRKPANAKETLLDFIADGSWTRKLDKIYSFCCQGKSYTANNTTYSWLVNRVKGVANYFKETARSQNLSVNNTCVLADSE